MKYNFTLGVLDQSPVRCDDTAAQALKESVELASFCENLNYHRYWVAEHHHSYAFASTSPELLVGQIAANTKYIRVGSGGIMLLNHSALKIAEHFRVLEAFYPGRIDLGIGKARGTDEFGAKAFAYPNSPIDKNSFNEQIDDLLEYIGGNISSTHQFSELIIQPGLAATSMPDIWFLGASPMSAQFAGRLGLKFAFAHFLNGSKEFCEIPTKVYRQNFRPSRFTNRPEVNIAIEALCAPTEQEALFLATSRNLDKAASKLDLEGFNGLLPPKEAMSYLERENIKEASNAYNSWYIDGNPQQVRMKIIDLAHYYEADQFLILTNCYSLEARKKSYELIAQSFN